MSKRLFLPVLLLVAFLGQIGCTQSPPPFNVRTYGALGDGQTKDTAAFQKALDQCSAAGGGQVLVPAGNYLIGSIALKSNTTLRLQADANLTGSPDLMDYPLIKARWEGQWVDAHRALISAQDASHIAIVGPGHIVGDPKMGGRQIPRRPCVIEPINCTDVTFEDFSAEQSHMWTIHPTFCQNVTAKNLTIRTTTGNGDGIDIDSCQHVRVESCDIDTGDDCIALKSGRGLDAYRAAKPTEDVLISHCTLGDSIFACIGIGSETSGGIRDVRIEHCKFTYANTYAIYIKSNTGRGAFIENISANDLDIASATGGFLRVNLLTSGIKGSDPVPGNDGIPSAKNFSFTDIAVANCGRLIDATSISPVKPLDGFTVANVTGNCQKGVILANIADADLRGISVTGFAGYLLATVNVAGTGLDGAEPYRSAKAQTARTIEP